MIILLFIGVIAFICETIDSTLGGGYGTILTPVLLLMGYEPLQIVPLILITEIFTGLGAGFLHHRVGNVDLKPGSREFRIGVILAACAIVGSVIAVFGAINLPKAVVKGYISFLILGLGLFNLLALEARFRFSWKKIVGLGFLASFNKGLSGGGYGPLIVGGQLLSGMPSKSAVGITSFAEGLTCIIGVLSYMVFSGELAHLDWELGGSLLVGSMLSVPFSVNLVRVIDEFLLRKLIALTIVLLGLASFYQTFHHLFVPVNIPLVILSVFVAMPFGYFLGKKVYKDREAYSGSEAGSPE